MKKILMVLVMMVTMSVMALATTNISDCSDLALIDTDPSGDFVLTNDIDCAGTGISSNTYLFGTLDGQGYTISNYNGEPLFVIVLGTVKNLKMSNATVSDNTVYVGGLVDGLDSTGTLENIEFQGTVVGVLPANAVGGLVGFMQGGTISNVTFDGDITGYYRTGGIVGGMVQGTVTGAKSSGTLTHSYDFAGGIVGLQEGGSNYVEKSASTMDIVGTNAGSCGGITGGVVSSAHLNQVEYKDGTISCQSRIGGAVGTINNGQVADVSVQAATISASATMGSLIGYVEQMISSNDIQRMYSSDVSYVLPARYRYIGGAIGYVDTLQMSILFEFEEVFFNSDQLPFPAIGGIVGTCATCNEVVGKTTAQLQTQATFTTFGFGTVWAMQQYPELINSPLYVPGDMFVSIVSPTNNTVQNESPVVVYQVYHEFAASANCSLYIDDVLNQTNSSVSISTFSEFSTDLADGVHTFYVECTADAQTKSSDVYTFNLSTCTPDWQPLAWTHCSDVSFTQEREYYDTNMCGDETGKPANDTRACGVSTFSLYCSVDFDQVDDPTNVSDACVATENGYIEWLTNVNIVPYNLDENIEIEAGYVGLQKDNLHPSMNSPALISFRLVPKKWWKINPEEWYTKDLCPKVKLYHADGYFGNSKQLLKDVQDGKIQLQATKNDDECKTDGLCEDISCANNTFTLLALEFSGWVITTGNYTPDYTTDDVPEAVISGLGAVVITVGAFAGVIVLVLVAGWGVGTLRKFRK